MTTVSVISPSHSANGVDFLDFDTLDLDENYSWVTAGAIFKPVTITATGEKTYALLVVKRNATIGDAGDWELPGGAVRLPNAHMFSIEGNPFDLYIPTTAQPRAPATTHSANILGSIIDKSLRTTLDRTVFETTGYRLKRVVAALEMQTDRVPMWKGPRCAIRFVIEVEDMGKKPQISHDHQSCRFILESQVEMLKMQPEIKAACLAAFKWKTASRVVAPGSISGSSQASGLTAPRISRWSVSPPSSSSHGTAASVSASRSTSGGATAGPSRAATGTTTPFTQQSSSASPSASRPVFGPVPPPTSEASSSNVPAGRIVVPDNVDAVAAYLSALGLL
ncbi:hypothetical protein K402DRAFT_417475 [Aulographum hederae CBS 113979]|uniref:Uncharacterized protein n=1 Tax=Aulographum hederae CBS 113979 TaxID=1176131 RepID=A0A6G1HBW9_9PEZI|nr:hypothetical protein K402DRAFT_417475 [Aulographum hederae CBS 113979]